MEPKPHPVRAYRKRLGKSLDDVAGELKISKSQLSRIETGAQIPQADVIERIALWSGRKIMPNDLIPVRSA